MVSSASHTLCITLDCPSHLTQATQQFFFIQITNYRLIRYIALSVLLPYDFIKYCFYLYLLFFIILIFSLFTLLDMYSMPCYDSLVWQTVLFNWLRSQMTSLDISLFFYSYLLTLLNISTSCYAPGLTDSKQSLYSLCIEPGKVST